ncbi:MAG TPA: hypothetical protein VIT68_00265 [Candidatus Gracilibacteria bacterium]
MDDIRKYIQESPQDFFLHKPVKERLSVKKELDSFCDNPDLCNFLNEVEKGAPFFMLDASNRFLHSYNSFCLCLERVLWGISVRKRFEKEIKYHPGNKPFSARQKEISRRYKETSPYTRLDFQNLIIHTCILLNRFLEISRIFVEKNTDINNLSFTSFSKHKKALKKHDLGPKLEEYQKFIVDQTEWFEIPLKILRDKFLMHSVEEHMTFLSSPECDHDNLELIIILHNPIKIVGFNPRRLALDLRKHLKTVSKIGLEQIKK